MDMPRRLEVKLGAAAWIASALYFPLQVVVASAWPQRYSFATNKISDLGVTTCDMPSASLRGEVFVCSPWHPLMNAGFVTCGVFTAVGAVLIWRASPRKPLSTIAFGTAFLAGIGGVLVGLAPVDVAPDLHRVGALLRVPGVFAPLLVAFVIRRQRPRLASFASSMSAVGAVGLVLFTRYGSGSWSGALERLALDPFTLWTLAVGVALLRRPFEDAEQA